MILMKELLNIYFRKKEVEFRKQKDVGKNIYIFKFRYELILKIDKVNNID